MKRKPTAFAPLAALTLLLSGTHGFGQTNSTDAAALTGRVDRIFAQWDQPGSPGCALAVISDGSVVYQRGYGSANLDYNVQIGSESVFYVASVSKQFVAACIALLAQQGKLCLDDDVRKYVPQLPDYGHTITLRHLVHHTSGLRDYLTLMQLAGMRWADVHTDDEVLALVCRQKRLNFPPGEQYRYCNTGYLLLAQVVQRVSGKSLREYAGQTIFEPLGMADSHFHDDRTHVVRNRAVSYEPGRSSGYQLSYLTNWDKVGSGGLLSTTADLARWDQNFYQATVGGEGFLKTIHTRGVLNDGTVLPYAFGLVHGRYKGQTTVSHGGSFMGFRTVLMRFPDHRFSVIILANLADVNPSALAKQIADLYLAEPIGRHLQAYCGTYCSDELQVSYQVLRDGPNLVVTRPGAEPTRLEGDAACDKFSMQGSNLLFTRNQDNNVVGFQIETGRAAGIQFTRNQ